MNDSAPNSVIAGASIVAAEHIALRYLFVSSGKWNGGNAAASSSSIGLDHIHDQLERSPDAAKYVDPIASFYADVTIPFTTKRQLPVVALTERLANDGGLKPPPVEIEIGGIESLWGTNLATVPQTKISALFKDSVTFFDSGHFVYAPAFLLQYPWDIHASASGARDTRAQHVSALTSLVGSSGVSYHRDLDSIRSKVLFKFKGEERGQELLAFINRRLAFLCEDRNRANVFAELIEPALRASGRNRLKRAKVDSGLSNMTWGDLRSASLEIVGATRHGEIVNWCRAAETGKTTVGVGERAIAALGQNVLDVENQDEREIVDSLSQAGVSDEHVLLIHPKLAVLYSRTSRSFTEMCDAIGGCPYVMLTNVVLAYNEYLLDQNAGLIDKIRHASRISRWAPGTSKTRALREDLKAREQLFVNQTLNFLPNIFRYPAEREMFKKVEELRGLEQRATGFERFTRNLYELRQSDAELDEREGTRRINLWLLALGILQFSGLFLAALGLDELKSASLRPVLWGGFAISLVVGTMVATTALWRR